MGEINLNHKLGNKLYELSKTNNFKNIVEIGMWDGTGSTWCVFKGLLDSKNTDTSFYSLEVVKERFDKAVDLYQPYIDQGYKINLLNGSIIKPDEVIEYASAHEPAYVNQQRGNFKLFLEADLKHISNVDYVLDSLPDEIDFLLLDGGEFSTYLEWEKLKDRAVNYIALDDTTKMKCKNIKNDIMNSNKFDIVVDAPSERNGILIVKRK